MHPGLHYHNIAKCNTGDAVPWIRFTRAAQEDRLEAGERHGQKVDDGTAPKEEEKKKATLFLGCLLASSYLVLYPLNAWIDTPDEASAFNGVNMKAGQVGKLKKEKLTDNSYSADLPQLRRSPISRF